MTNVAASQAVGRALGPRGEQEGGGAWSVPRPLARTVSPGVGGVHFPLDEVLGGDGVVLGEEPGFQAVGAGGVDALGDADAGVDEEFDNGAVDEAVDVEGFVGPEGKGDDLPAGGAGGVAGVASVGEVGVQAGAVEVDDDLLVPGVVCLLYT